MLFDPVDEPLRLAVLGDLAELLPLVDGAMAGGFEVSRFYETGRLTADLQERCPQASIGDNWEELANSNYDAVLFGCDMNSPDAAARFKRLAREGVTLVVVHPACEPIVALEIEMIQRDTKALILPWCESWRHPAVAELLSKLNGDDPAISKIERVVFNRTFPAEDSLNARRWFARDAFLIQQIIGRIAQVQAMGVSADARLPANVSVQMTSDSGILSQWSGANSQHESAELAVIGAGGKVVLEMNHPGEWKLTTPRATTTHQFTAEEAATATLEQLKTDQPAAADWSDACRALEVLDAAEYSLRRGKTTIITDERPSEESTFKGMMAAGGCGFLLFTFFAFLAVLAIDAAEPPFRQHLWWRAWPWWICAPMVFFLALQLLQLLFRSKSEQ